MAMAVACIATASSLAFAGQIVTQPIPGRQASSAKSAVKKSATVTTSSATSSTAATTPSSAKSASTASTSGGLKWKSPGVAPSQDVDEAAPANAAIAATATATTAKHAVATSKVQTAAQSTVAVKTSAAKKSTLSGGANGIAERLKELETKTAASKVQPIASQEDDHSQVIQTAATAPKIDPFGDDELPAPKAAATKTPATKASTKAGGTPATRAAQAGVDPGRQDGPKDPFPGDRPLEQTQAQPPGQLPQIEEGLTQAPQRGPEPCPSPRDLKPLNQISNKIDAEPGEFPAECGLGNEAFDPRQWSMTTYTWKATGLCHKPLYFEDVQLERYGNTFSPLLQPAISGAHFFASSVILPYKMGLEAPLECVYPLGTYRPGSCAPFYIGPLPISARGALYQTGTVLGLVFLIP